MPTTRETKTVSSYMSIPEGPAGQLSGEASCNGLGICLPFTPPKMIACWIAPRETFEVFGSYQANRIRASALFDTGRHFGLRQFNNPP